MAKKKKIGKKTAKKKAHKALKKAKKAIHHAVKSGALTPEEALTAVHDVQSKIPGLKTLDTETRRHVARPHGDANAVVDACEVLLVENGELLASAGLEAGAISAKWDHANALGKLHTEVQSFSTVLEDTALLDRGDAWNMCMLVYKLSRELAPTHPELAATVQQIEKLLAQGGRDVPPPDAAPPEHRS